MALRESLEASFKVYNVSVGPEALQKCEDLCSIYAIDPEDFLDQWLAYAASNSHGLAPTVHALEKLERCELKNQSKSEPSSSRTQHMQIDMTPEVIENSMLEEAPSTGFSTRKDAGSVVQAFGETSNSFKQKYSSLLHIKIQNSGENKYMCERLLLKRGCLDGISQSVISDICRHYRLEVTREKFKDYSSDVVVCGRIVSEIGGKLDHNSLLLEGLVDLYKGQRVKLYIDKVKKVRLFPGQSVTVTGNNMKSGFTATEIFTGAPLPCSPVPNLPENVHIIVAAGPFTFLDNLTYEPLGPLLEQVEKTAPNVLILMGPFLDRNHPHLETLNESYDTFFESIVEGIMQRLHDIKVQVILVPSDKDIHNHVIFPSLPYKVKKRYENLYLAPNPFIVDIEGLIIAGSTADVLFHLGKVELSVGPNEDRVGQIVGHIFKQKSFYPLHPTDADLKVDYQLLSQFGMFKTAPHVMILPSNLQHFVKIVEDCVVINPQRLIKGAGGGTFASFEVRAAGGGKMCERVSCLIQKV